MTDNWNMILKEANGFVTIRIGTQEFPTNLDFLKTKGIDLSVYEYFAYERPIGRMIITGGTIPDLYIHLPTIEAFDETILTLSPEVQALASSCEAILNNPSEYAVPYHPFSGMSLAEAIAKCRKIAQGCGQWALGCRYSTEQLLNYSIGNGTAAELDAYKADVTAVQAEIANINTHIDGLQTVEDVITYYRDVQAQNPWAAIFPECVV